MRVSERVTAMLKLYGFHTSHYFNMVKLALLEKGFEFEEVHSYPSREPLFLTMSPMGEVPFLEAREGFISDVPVIMEFLEEIIPEVPLLPEDVFERAKVRELMSILLQHIEQPVSRLLDHPDSKGAPDQARVDQTIVEVERGLDALARLARFDPYLCGEEFSYADVIAYHALDLVNSTMKKFAPWTAMDEMTDLADWRYTVAARPIVHQMDNTLISERDTFSADS
ncbi:MAG: glutathione S-transferase [Porticoccus sp.]|jgi:glutathione S-transferase|tara:strand:+ start:20330 stop:21004 length:675 start_codon:yes stop_codon:yes gene_type:complete